MRLSDDRLRQISDDPSIALGSLRGNPAEIDKEIENIQTHINNLKAVRQTLLQKVHQIGQDNFMILERKIIYKIMRETPTTVKELSIMINEDKTKVRKALKGLQGKVDKGKMKTFVEGLA